MNKRRILTVATLVLVLALSVAMLAACGDKVDKGGSLPKGDANADYYPANFTAVDYSGMEEVADMDAYDLLCEVYDNWASDKGYRRTQYFSFEAKPIGQSITNFCHEVYKIDGDKLYRTSVVIQDGVAILADDKYTMTRFYYDGTSAFRGFLDDSKDKKIIPGDPNHENGLFYVSELPKMEAFNGNEDTGTVEEMMKTYTTHMTTYTWRNRDNLIDDGFKVYKDENGNFRFTITINCDKNMMDTVHEDARIEFEDSTGANTGTVEMTANTTLDLVVREVDGLNKVIAWRRTEQYKGKKGASIPAAQTCIETFSYDEADYKITDADIA